jgi:hypothetical protein
VSRRVLSLVLQSGSEPERQAVPIEQLVIAGWTGRDPAAVEKHIQELEVLGVRRPASVPVFYRAAAARLTTDTLIEATGTGSDHTDREVEKYSVTVSKQMCDKPIASVFWAYDDVAPHWDRLLLRAHVTEGGARLLYQEGPVTAMLDPAALISRFDGSARLPEGMLMFCGTLAAHGGVRPTSEFDFELDDPVLGRTIKHGYRVQKLPALG